MTALRLFLLVLLTLAAVGCGDADASTTTSGGIDQMRSAAVRLVFADVNATALQRAWDRRVLRKRMRRYVARRWLDRRAERTSNLIAKFGGSRYFQVWTEAITVGRWESQRRTGGSAAVAFLGYETVCPTEPSEELPMERFTVRMVYERGGWRLVTYDKRWLTGAGPMGVSGALTIRSLPERVIFRNPRPRTWRYRGPHFPGITPCSPSQTVRRRAR